MATLLKVLTVLLFLLAIAAFIFGLANFQKREELIGRTHELEKFAQEIAVFIETEPPPVPEEGEVDHDKGLWDQDEPTREPVDAIETSDAEEFWSEYKDYLENEKDVQETFNLSTRDAKEKLSNYYHMVSDESGKMVIDRDSQGRPITDGPDTMHDLLKGVTDRAEAQRKQLNESRRQLVDLREKMEEIVGMLNEQKKLRRENLATIYEREQKIEELNGIIAQRETEIARLEREVADLQDEKSSLEAELAQKDEDLQEKQTEIERLNERLRLALIERSGSRKDDDAIGIAVRGVLSAGVKGKIVDVQSELSFVIVQFSEEAIGELIGEDGSFAPIELMVHRPNADGTPGRIITRIRVTTPPAGEDRIAIADNKYGWEQEPVEIGDVVIY